MSACQCLCPYPCFILWIGLWKCNEFLPVHALCFENCGNRNKIKTSNIDYYQILGFTWDSKLNFDHSLSHTSWHKKSCWPWTNHPRRPIVPFLLAGMLRRWRFNHFPHHLNIFIFSTWLHVFIKTNKSISVSCI